MSLPPDRPELVVLDTNAVLDCRLFCDPAAAALSEALDTGRLRWLATAAMRDELVHVLGRPLDPRWEPRRLRLLQDFERLSVDWVDPAPPTGPVPRCSDPSDQKFVDLALHGRARWLVTRDRALLRLHRHARKLGLLIVPPQYWASNP